MSSNEMKNKKRYSFAEILITALVSMILTFISSYLLISHQLSEEQEYWIERQKKERLLQKIEKQTKLFEEINEGILQSEILARELKILASAFNVNNSIALETNKIKDNKNSNLNEKLMEYHKHTYGFFAKVEMIPLYFSSDVYFLIIPLTKLLEENYNYNLNFGDRVNLDSISEYLSKDYETIPALEECRMKIILEMSQEMESLSNIIFEDNK